MNDPLMLAIYILIGIAALIVLSPFLSVIGNVLLFLVMLVLFLVFLLMAAVVYSFGYLAWKTTRGIKRLFGMEVKNDSEPYGLRTIRRTRVRIFGGDGSSKTFKSTRISIFPLWKRGDKK